MSLLLVPCVALGHSEDEHGDTCAEKSVAATAIETRQDLRAFVQCAVEYVQEHGTEEARRAFSEDARWKSGQFYIFAFAQAPRGEEAKMFVFPPDPSRQGTFFGPLPDQFGHDIFAEYYRLARHFGGGWIYYAFTNPTSGLDEPKASYAVNIDWDGTPAMIGAGIYERDLPGTCEATLVNAAEVAHDPSLAVLSEFVRCAAQAVEEKGYFAAAEFESDPRWRSGSVYVFGMDEMGRQVFTGNRVRVGGATIHEWGASSPTDQFGGRDIVGVANTFGESVLYYNAFSPDTGRGERKVAVVKRVSAQGVPVLVGSGYYLADGAAE